MKKSIFSFLLVILNLGLFSQTNMTPERLIQMGKVYGMGINGKDVVFGVSQYSFETNSKTHTKYIVDINGKQQRKLSDKEVVLDDKHVSPDGKNRIVIKNEKLKNISGQDFHEDVEGSNVMIFDELNYRHWDHWEDGEYSHVMFQSTGAKDPIEVDIMQGEPFDCPQQPFGGDEDYLWSPDSKSILYVTKKSTGVNYASSTNSDIYQYDLATRKTVNITSGNKGYDTSPAFSSQGQLAWLQMKRDGYESDKNDILIKLDNKDLNLTAGWDGTVNSFIWSNDGNTIYFVAPVLGTVQLFELAVPKKFGTKSKPPRQITEGQFDVNGIVGQVDKMMAVTRRDMNHAPEIFSVDLATGEMKQITFINEVTYAKTKLGKIEKRITKTTDGQDLLSWVIYPPDFDPTKKYPTILYCQGGPQGALSQFYSYRWNFQLMAANGYIIIAPNRRGMPGYGVAWNEQISKDYGGQNMHDYLSAIDDISKESYVDNDRLGCIGASYGGYSVFYLAGMHEGRFKSFISHDGIFDWRSMYGTTEEMFFVNWDLGGAYWDKENKIAQKAYNEFNPTTYVHKWDTPILIIQGGKDYRVPIGQGLAAFQAAQLQGIKSKLLFFPEENHWVLDHKNSLIWQREFYKWLKETL